MKVWAWSRNMPWHYARSARPAALLAAELQEANHARSTLWKCMKEKRHIASEFSNCHWFDLFRFCRLHQTPREFSVIKRRPTVTRSSLKCVCRARQEKHHCVNLGTHLNVTWWTSLFIVYFNEKLFSVLSTEGGIFSWTDSFWNVSSKKRNSNDGCANMFVHCACRPTG